jgi:hypothetical protein
MMTAGGGQLGGAPRACAVNASFGYRGRFGDAADSHVGAITFRLPL